MKRRRGFAMIYALIILGLVAMAVYAMASHFAFQVRRTRTVDSDAQLHQYLLAANEYVKAHINQWGETIDLKTVSIQLPDDPKVQDARVSISLQEQNSNTAKLEIVANSNRHDAIEQLKLTFTGGHWHITGAELIGEGQ